MTRNTKKTASSFYFLENSFENQSPILPKWQTSQTTSFQHYAVSLTKNKFPNLFERMVHFIQKKGLYKEIFKYLQRNNLRSNTQFGFRTSYSTIDAILYCTEALRKAIDNNKCIACSILDLPVLKAFDSQKRSAKANCAIRRRLAYFL